MALTTRQHARLLAEWVASIVLDPHLFGTHSLRRTKAALIYRRTGNLRATQLLLRRAKIEGTVRCLGSRSTTPSQQQNKSASELLGGADKLRPRLVGSFWP